MPESIWKLPDAWNDKADQSCQNCVANILSAIEAIYFFFLSETVWNLIISWTHLNM